MSDWYGNARSNYFKVKDPEKFKEFCNDWDVEMISNEHEFYTEECIQCKDKEPNKTCDGYVKRVVGECEGKKIKIVLHGFLGTESNGGLPCYRFVDMPDGSQKQLEFDAFLKELASHLEDGWVAVMQEVGAEKLRYITGISYAINSKGEEKVVSIADIYELAKKTLGPNVTDAEY